MTGKSEKEMYDDIRFISYLQQYSEEGIEFILFVKSQTPKYNSIRTNVTDINGNVESYYTINNEIKEPETIERFYKRRWIERQKTLTNELDFVHIEIGELEMFSDKIKKIYEAQYYPLLDFFKKAKQRLESPLQGVFFKDEKYKLAFENSDVPLNISEYYIERNEYVYLNTSTIKNVPVLRSVYYSHLRELKISSWLEDQFDIALESYAKGFEEGFNYDFTFFASTPEAKKELILKAITTKFDSFPITFKSLDSKEETEKSAYFDKDSFYKKGILSGRNYRAWQIILETPNYFKDEAPFVGFLKSAGPSKENVNSDSSKPIKTFPSYFGQNKIFADKLKNEFATEKGKNIKLVIEALKELGLIKLESRGFKDFYECMKQYFNRDIGTYQSINDFKDWKTDAYKSDYEIIMNRVKGIQADVKIAN